MSEMQSNKGIIKELYNDIENPEEKIIQLHLDTEIPFDDLVWVRDDGEVEWDYIEHDDYSLINGRLFDVSGAPDNTDEEYGERDHVQKVGENEYEVDLYYYNGGANMEEFISDYLDKEAEGLVDTKALFYAVKVDGGYFIPAQSTQYSSNTPLLFLSEIQAKNYMSNVQPTVERYSIVKLKES